MKWSD